MPKNRNEWFIMSTIPLLFAAMIWGIVAIQASEARQFRREGIVATATVVDKFTTRSSSSDTTDHNFAVTYMSGGSSEAPKVDLLSGESSMGSIDVGQFTRSKFEVGSRTYNRTAIGDDVAIYYLASDPTEALLKDQVDNYSPLPLQIVIWVLVATAVYCLIRGLLTRPAPPTASISSEQMI